MPPSHKSVAKKTSRKRSAGRAALSSRIKKLEKQVGQRGLAKMLGVSPRSIRRYKDGTRKPRRDVVFKLNRIGRAAKGIRKTKSIKRKRARTEKILREHPEVTYFETRRSFEFAETEHIDLLDIRVSDVPQLLEYLIFEGCDAAYFVIRGVDENTKEDRYYSSEIMSMEDFSESWEEVLSSLMQQYNLTVKQIDLIGIKYHAPTPQTG